MDRREAIKQIGVTASAIALSQSNVWGQLMNGSRPNIIFMVADNMGREAVDYYGDPTFETPRMNAMAKDGVVFDNCLIATPLCAPARCGWNTGRHPYRVGINTQPRPDNPDHGLSLDEITIARLLKDAGYDTALFGKWNLGYDEKFNPLNHGFNTFYGSNAGHADYYTHLYNRDMKSHFYRGREPVEDEGYFDTLFTNEAIGYLQSRKGNDQPFYMNLTFYAPHGPYQAPPGFYHSDDPDINYKSMIEYLDLCVGRVLDEVELLGMSENTLIVFLSDQGGSRTNGFGRTLWEIGLKVICNAVWAGRISQGTRSAVPWIHYDLYATFAGLAGASVPPDRVMDTRDVWPLFEGREERVERPMHWTYRKEDVFRDGDLKLHMTDEQPDGLFDLSKDPEEKKNLMDAHPDRVGEMRTTHLAWKAECAAHQTSQPS